MFDSFKKLILLLKLTSDSRWIGLYELSERIVLDLFERLANIEIADSHFDSHHLSSNGALVHKAFQELDINNFVLICAVCDKAL